MTKLKESHLTEEDIHHAVDAVVTKWKDGTPALAQLFGEGASESDVRSDARFVVKVQYQGSQVFHNKDYRVLVQKTNTGRKLVVSRYDGATGHPIADLRKIAKQLLGNTAVVAMGSDEMSRVSYIFDIE